MYLLIAFLVFSSASGLIEDIEISRSQPLNFLRYFRAVRSVLFVDLEGKDDSYLDRSVYILMKYNKPSCIVRPKIPTATDINQIDENAEKNDTTLPEAVKKCLKDREPRYTGSFMYMSSPKREKVFDVDFRNALVSLTTSPTIFLFYGLQNNGTVTIDMIADRLEEFFELIWGTLRMPRVMGAVLTSSGEPILCTYDPLKWAQGTYGRGIKFFTQRQILTDATILFNPKIMNDYPLKVAFFGRYPTSVKYREPQIKLLQRLAQNSWGYGGLDGLVMGDAIVALKFKPILEDFGPDEPYGYILQNGSVYGTLAQVVNMRADIAFNSRFVKAYGVDDNYEFMKYVHTDRLCVIVPKSVAIPLWTKVGGVYSGQVWSVLAAQTMMISVLRWIQFNVMRRRGYRSLVRVVVETHAVILVPVGRVARAPLRQRLLLTLCLFMNLVLVSLFQGNLHAAYNTRAFYPDIHSLVELDRSDLVLTVSQGFRDVFSGSQSETYTSLDAKLRISSGLSNNIDMIANGARLATLSRESDIRLLGRTAYVGVTGLPLLHIVEECPMSYMLAYIVSRNFPFKRHMYSLMTRLVEGGLPAWYNQITEYVIVTHERTSQVEHSGYITAPLKMEHVASAFIILYGGTTVALAFLIGELCVHRIKMAKLKKAF